MYFGGVQMSVAHQFTGKQQHRDLVAIAHFRLGVGVDVEHIDAEGLRLRHRAKLAQHLLAQAAAVTRVQEKARHWVSGGEVRRCRWI